jgi:hypothetical protein
MCEVLGIVLGDTCGSNMGGTKLKAHIAGHNDILTFGALGTGATAFTIASPHVMKSGKQFHTLEFLQDSGVNNFGPGGANSGAKVKTFVCRVPSNNAQAILLSNTVGNGIYPVLALVEDANMPDGSYDQYGTARIHAVLTCQKLNGTNNGEGSVLEFTLSVTQPSTLTYTASVPLTPAA